ncbi:hypothetical protein E4665_05140 [Sporolactobacillus shoreae]|uniref:YhaN AAA domain-containing protein n=1 Tax=Sporolactobacillus shoreae TaxID=1465501 RepID=A0A4Z0GRS2_9BACL|nr:AAA family ATPase [Sporolactobacillus shoreae]TGA99170.1 hypothetical protein E4665_05140 [Sporolactobacillus shoreae]
MKIKELDIHQFGRFEGRKINLPESPFAFIYGANEAGKSTVMNFILCTLFGYPQRTALRKWVDEGAEVRIGGSVVFAGDDGRDYRLERVYTKNGAPELFIGNSERSSINKVLPGVDRMLFRNVFCFDLDGLRGIEKTKPSDLNDLLLGAGMIGSSHLSDLEHELAKKTDLIFKKKGKVPEINQLFQRLDQSAADLKKWEKKLDVYREIQQGIAKDQMEIRKLEDERKIVQARFMEWTAFSSVRPLIAGFRLLEEEIGDAETSVSFPKWGRSRFSDLEKLAAGTDNEIADLNEQIQFLNESMAAIPIRKNWILAEGRLSAWFHSAARDEQDLREIERLGRKIRANRAGYAALLERLGSEWDTEKILNASVSLPFFRQLKEKVDQWNGLDLEKRNAAHALEMQKTEVDQLELRLKQIENRRTDEETSRAYSGRRASAEGKKKFPALMPVSIAAVLLTILFSGFSAILITPFAALTVLGFGLLLSAFYILAMFRLRQESRPPISGDNDHRREAEARLTEEQLSAARTKCAIQEQNYSSFENRLLEVASHNRNWLKENGYAENSIVPAEEASRLIGEARAFLGKLDELNTELEARGADHNQFIDEKLRLTKELSLPEGDAAYIEQQFNLEKEKYARIHNLVSKRDVLLQQKKRLDQKKARLHHEMLSLFEQVGVENRDRFIEAADQSDRIQSLVEKRDDHLLQMIEGSGGEEQLKHFIADFDQGKWEGIDESNFRARLSDLDGKIRTTRNLLSEKQAENKNLEENDTYRDKLDSYQQLLEEVNSKAREWAVYRTAQWAIERAKDQYRRQRLPKILNRAKAYFESITSGEYVGLQLYQEGGFIAERRDGRHFKADELSRGTAEQLYLSLRLALAELVSPGEKLPLIIDDSLVNFDSERSDRTLTLLKKVSEQRQVILFTCHRMPPHFVSDESVITLA